MNRVKIVRVRICTMTVMKSTRLDYRQQTDCFRRARSVLPDDNAGRGIYQTSSSRPKRSKQWVNTYLTLPMVHVDSLASAASQLASSRMSPVPKAVAAFFVWRAMATRAACRHRASAARPGWLNPVADHVRGGLWMSFQLLITLLRGSLPRLCVCFCQRRQRRKPGRAVCVA